MKIKQYFSMALVAVAFLSSCTNSDEQKATTPKNYDVIEVETVKSDFSIPDFLQPVWINKDGYTAEQTVEIRNSITPMSGLVMDNNGNYLLTHYNEDIPSAIVRRGGPVSELEYAPIKEVGDVATTTILGTMTLKEMTEDERSRMKAITVIHDGKVVYEDYMGMRDFDNHVWASGSKIFPGLLAYNAERQGMLDIEKQVVDYLPELKGTEWEGVKVKHVLHQCSGMDVSESRNQSSPTHPVTILYSVISGNDELPEGTSLMSAIQQCTKAIEPGTRFEYSSINTHVVTAIVERIYEKPIEDVLTEEIWTKIGMEGDATLGLSQSGEPFAFGGFSSRLRDFARFGMLFTPSWNVVSSKQIIADEYFTKVKEAANADIYGHDYMSKRLMNDFQVDNLGAAYQWDIIFPDGDMYKSGRYGQCLYVSPETNTVVVWYSSSYMAEVWVHAYAREIVNQLFRNN